MAEKFEKLGPLYREIGAEGAGIASSDPDGLFIYFEVTEGSAFGAVFRDDGSEVHYYDPSDALCDLVFEAWRTESSDQNMRWLVMEYDVKGLDVHVQFKYLEEVNPDDSAFDRREVALGKRYGDRPVIYPPVPDYFRRLE